MTSFKATRKILPTTKIYLKHFQFVLEFKTLTVRAVLGAYKQSLFHKKPKLRDTRSCISTNIQDGGQRNISNQNTLPHKADIKIL